MKNAVVVSAFIACAAPAWAYQSQSLAEIAAKQKKARTGQAKVITENELKNAKARIDVAPANPADTAESPKPEAGQAAAAKEEKTEEQLRADLKLDIDTKITEQQERIATVRKQMDEAQAELKDLGNYTFGGRRQALAQVITDGQAEIAKSQQTIADLQEQARQKGLPVAR